MSDRKKLLNGCPHYEFRKPKKIFLQLLSNVGIYHTYLTHQLEISKFVIKFIEFDDKCWRNE